MSQGREYCWQSWPLTAAVCITGNHLPTTLRHRAQSMRLISQAQRLAFVAQIRVSHFMDPTRSRRTRCGPSIPDDFVLAHLHQDSSSSLDASHTWLSVSSTNDLAEPVFNTKSQATGKFKNQVRLLQMLYSVLLYHLYAARALHRL